MTEDRTNTFGRALQLVLEVVETEVLASPPPGVGRLAAQLGLHESQTSRMLKDLVAVGLVSRDEPTRGFVAGPRFFELARAGLDLDLHVRARPVLAELSGRYQAPALLAVRSGELALTVDLELPRGQTRVASSGWWRSCWCTGAGRALLLDADPASLHEVFGDEPFDEGGPMAARDLDDLVGRIGVDAARGVAVADSEFEHAVVEVAAPVRDDRGRIVAAVAVMLPSTGRPDDLTPVVDDVRAAAATLSTPAVSSEPGV